MSYVLINGEIVERSQAKVDIEDRGYQFGDGVYEVVRIYNGKPFALSEHLDRFYESAEKIYMKIRYEKMELEKKLLSLLNIENAGTCSLYLQYTRGTAFRNHVIPSELEGTLTAYILHGSQGRNTSLMEKGISTILAEDTRWLHCDIKSISLLGNVLLKHKATMAGCAEAILHRGSTVTEGSATNVWMIKDGVLKTHPANNLILNGITRQKILTVCKRNGIPVEEKAFTVSELLNADEAFISSTTLEITPIISIDGVKVGNGSPGELTRTLHNLFVKFIEEECQTTL